MPEALTIQPVIKVTGLLRRAASDCCAAKLNPGTEPETFTCRSCGQPCERVLGDPQEVVLHD